jgi:hypothetical protein
MADENVQADAPVSDDTSKTKRVKAVEAPAQPRKPPVLFRGVHYVRDDYSHLDSESKPGEHVGATIIAIHEGDDEAVTLVGEGFQASPVAHDEGGAVGTWHWPEKE